MRVTFLHTNDMHGRQQAMARLSHLARRTRSAAEARGGAVFFWDAGDALDRRFRACSMTKGAALARVLNAMGYSLSAMGNDILLTYGPQAMERLARRLDFPVLAANCRDLDGPLSPGLEESALFPLPVAGAVGVFGLTAPWGGLYASFGLRFPDTHETARSCVAALKARGASVIVALSHLGLADDRRLVDAVPGIDLVIGAHSHDLLKHGEDHAGVLIVQAGHLAQTLGVVEARLDREGQLQDLRARVVNVPEDEPSDPAVVAAWAEAEAEADAVGARPVADLLAPLDLDHEGECALGNLTADAFRERLGAEVALIISGQLTRGLPAGTATYGDLNEVSLVTANPQRTRVLGSEILTALERGIDPAVFRIRPHGFRGTPVGWPQISGMTVEWDPGRPVGDRVVGVQVGTAPLDPGRSYLLAHSDAETLEELPVLQLDPGQDSHTEVPTVTREVIEDYLRRHAPVAAPPLGRWRRVGSANG